MTQRAFDFRIVVVVRWKLGWLIAHWNTGLRSFFRSWLDALPAIWHPLNHHVVIKVRA